MNKFLAFISIGVIIAGCSTTYNITSHAAAKEFLEDLSGTIQTLDSSSYRAGSMYVFGDSLAFTDEVTWMPTAIALRDIRRINTVEHSAGANQAGLATLAVLGAEATIFKGRSGSALMRGTVIAGALGVLARGLIGLHNEYLVDSGSIARSPFEPENRFVHLTEIKQYVKKAIRIGLPTGDYTGRGTGSFPNTKGYSVGISTGIKLTSDLRGYSLLGIEAGYTKIIGFKLNVPQIVNESGPQRGYVYRDVYDERHEVSITEVGLLPQFVFPVSDHVMESVYLGGSIGIGGDIIQVNRISHTLKDSTTYAPSPNYGPYGEYNIGGNLHSVISFNLGTSFYYGHAMVDLRYRITNIVGGQSYQNLYLQFGIVL